MCSQDNKLTDAILEVVELNTEYNDARDSIGKGMLRAELSQAIKDLARVNGD